MTGDEDNPSDATASGETRGHESITERIARRKAGGLGRNVVLVGLAYLAPALSAILTGPLFARSLGVAGRGELAAVVSLYVLLVPIATAGLPEAVIYYTSVIPTSARLILRRASRLIAVSGLVAATAAIVSAFYLTENRDDVHLAIFAGAAIAPAVMVAGPRGLSSALARWDLVNAERYLGAALKLTVVVVLFGIGSLTLSLAVAIWVLTPVFAGAVYMILGKELSREDAGEPRFSGEFLPPTKRVLLSYATRTSGGALGGMILARADQVLMIPLAGATQLGLYAAAVNVSDAASLANLAVRDVLFATQSGQKDTERLSRAARSSFFVALGIGLSLLSPVVWWFPAVFGEEFREAIPAVGVIVIGGVLGVPGAVAGAGLSSLGRPGLRSWSLGVAALANVMAVLVLVPELGAVGAAMAAFIGSTVASNLNIFFLMRLEPVHLRDFYLVRLDDVRRVLRVSRSFLAATRKR